MERHTAQERPAGHVMHVVLVDDLPQCGFGILLHVLLAVAPLELHDDVGSRAP